MESRAGKTRWSSGSHAASAALARGSGARPPSCGRRAGGLHFVSSVFVCRKCAHLVHRSQRADLSHRGWMKIRKAYRSRWLDPDEAEYMENLPKPKGMHWRTFQGHWEAIERGAAMRDAWMLTPSRSVLRMLSRHSNP